MGTGKSTVGRLVASRLGWQFLDTDALIESRAGCSISQIFAEHGESHFRQLESDVCVELATPEFSGRVIATGGGIVLKAENRDALRQAGLVICLDAPAEQIVARLAGYTDRPLLAGADPVIRVTALLASRADAYGALEHHIDTTSLPPELVAEQVMVLWRSTPRPYIQALPSQE